MNNLLLMTKNKETEIDKLIIKCRAKKKLTAVDLAVAERVLESLNFSEKLIGCEALIRYSESAISKERALAEFESLCKQALEDSSLQDPTLLYSLSFVPDPCFIGNKVFREITLRSATDVNLGARTNAMVLLERLARLGDTEAVEILRRSLHDSHEYVRNNARQCLDRLATGMKSET